ncbi:unnamed protein product, partial [Didymodactylos carnosus]
YYTRKYSRPSVRVDDHLNYQPLTILSTIIPSTVKTPLKASLTSYATTTTASSSIILDKPIVLSSMRQKDLELKDVFQELPNHLLLETKSLTSSSSIIGKHLSGTSNLSKNNNNNRETSTTIVQIEAQSFGNNNKTQQKSSVIIENSVSV